MFYVESLQNKRRVNEDHYCHMEIRVNHEAKVAAYAVADGMGGLEAGSQYSRQAISLWFQELVQLLLGEQFRDCSLQTQIETLQEFTGQALHKINQMLYRKGMDSGIRGGTTLTTALHFWDTWVIGNCGDSPVYFIKDGTLSLGSEIQNVAWQMVREGKTKVGSTIFYQNKNKLLEYLGKREEIHPYVTTVEEKELDGLLLGTDGAFGDMMLEEMQSYLWQTKEEGQILSGLLELARSQGETDNQTAIYIPLKKEENEMVSLPELKQEAVKQPEKGSSSCYREVPEEKERRWRPGFLRRKQENNTR